LIDTDILIDALRGVADASAFLTAQRAAFGVQISIISAMELVVGCRNAAELARVRRFLRQVAVLPTSEPISHSSLRLVETFFLSHGLLILDALIGATALEHGLTLYTRNVRHFQMIPALTISRPY
jgi:hypothetical protein